MDPITAVGFAASILTFIDFSWNLVAGTYEVLNSATCSTSENAHIGNVIDDLKKATDGLDSEMLGNSKHEMALRELSTKCANLSEDLLKQLGKLKVKGENSKWKSLKVKWDSMRKEKNVESMVRRLDEYRSQILIRLNLMLRQVSDKPDN
jgi:hypothetical protein